MGHGRICCAELESCSFRRESNVEASTDVPPVLTRTWFHTGVYAGRNQVSNFFAGLIQPWRLGEYFREPNLTDLASQRAFT